MEAVRKDPAGEVKKARNKRSFGVKPLEFVPDMPGHTADGSCGRVGWTTTRSTTS